MAKIRHYVAGYRGYRREEYITRRQGKMRFTTGGSNNNLNCDRIDVDTLGSWSQVEATSAGVGDGGIGWWNCGWGYCRRVGWITGQTWSGFVGGWSQGLNGGGKESGITNERGR